LSVRSPQVAGDHRHGFGEGVVADLFQQIALDVRRSRRRVDRRRSSQLLVIELQQSDRGSTRVDEPRRGGKPDVGDTSTVFKPGSS
jgi:hypothetical protein